MNREYGMSTEKTTISRLKLFAFSTILIVGLTSIALSLTQVQMAIPNAGAIKSIGFGIYWNSACTNRATSITWGTIDPGSSKSVTVYVKNEGNAAATLTKTVKNWVPTAAASYLSMNWNYTNQLVGVNKVQPVKLTLSVASNITAIDSFSFDIVITAAA